MGRAAPVGVVLFGGVLLFAGSSAAPEELGAIFFTLVYTCMCIALLALTPVAAFQSLAGEWDDNSFELLAHHAAFLVLFVNHHQHGIFQRGFTDGHSA